MTSRNATRIDLDGDGRVDVFGSSLQPSKMSSADAKKEKFKSAEESKMKTSRVNVSETETKKSIDDSSSTRQKSETDTEPKNVSLHLLNMCQKSQWIAVLRILQETDSAQLNLSLSDEDGMTPLLFAIKDGSLKAVETLVSKGSDLGEKLKDGKTNAHIAAAFAGKEVVAFLLSKKINVKSTWPVTGEIPLHLAIKRPTQQTMAIVSLLLQAWPESRLAVDINYTTPLMLACESGSLNVCKELLSEMAEQQIKIRRNDTGDSLMHAAVKSNNAALVKLLAEYGAPINVQNNLGKTPLHIVAERNAKDLAEILFDFKAEPDLADSLGKTALHIAAERGHSKIIELLIDKFHASVLNRTKDGSSLMHIASRNGHTETIVALSKRGVPLNVSDKRGAHGLHIAAMLGHGQVLKTLLNRGANVDAKTRDNFTALHVAIQAGKPEIVDLLLCFGADLSINGGDRKEAALHVASRHPDEDVALQIVELLIKSGADLNATLENGETPLHIASNCGHCKIIEMLMIEGADYLAVSKTGDTILHSALLGCRFKVVSTILTFIETHKTRDDCTVLVRTQNLDGFSSFHIVCGAINNNIFEDKHSWLEMVQLFLEYGAIICEVIEKTNENVFHLLASSNQPEALKLILSLFHCSIVQKFINNQNKQGQTALMIACLNNHAEIVKILMDEHVRYDIADETNLTALHIAAREGLWEICQLMLEKNVFGNIRTESGHTPLHMAAKRGHTSVVEKLIKTSQAQIDAMDLDSRTPLHFAAEAGHLETCKVLLGLGASATTSDSFGRTPLHLAAESDHSDIVKLLLNAKSDVDLLMAADNQGFTCAHLAAKNGSSAVIRELLSIDKDSVINAKTCVAKSTALHIATEKGNLNVVKLLLEAGADPLIEDIDGLTPMLLVAKFGHIHLLDIFPIDKWDICSEKIGFYPLHMAPFYRQFDFFDAILRYSPVSRLTDKPGCPTANLILPEDLRNEFGFSVLHLATLSGLDCMLRHALNIPDARIDLVSQPQSLSCLHLAARTGKVLIMNVLLSFSRDFLTMKDSVGKTALHIAAQFGQVDAASLLISQGCNVNECDQKGWTSLHHACWSGHLNVADALMKAGANTFAESNDGKTPLALAISQNDAELSIFLIKKHKYSIGVLSDKRFSKDLLATVRKNEFLIIREFILNAQSPIDAAVYVSKNFKLIVEKNPAKWGDLEHAVEYCENKTSSLLTESFKLNLPSSVLKSRDELKHKLLIDLLIDHEQKKALSLVQVQSHLDIEWGGGQFWKAGRLLVLFLALLLCPPLWFLCSLPLRFRTTRAPVVRFLCHLVSHVYFTLLLISTTLFASWLPFHSRSWWPKFNEVCLLFWFLGITIEEMTRWWLRRNISVLRTLQVFLFIVVIVLHTWCFLLPLSEQDTASLLYYIRNQVLSSIMLLAFFQYLQFLTLHRLFGPWAVIIGHLVFDLFRFLAILLLFLFAFTITMTSILQPVYPASSFNSTSHSPATLPVVVERLYFTMFGLVELQDVIGVEYLPIFGRLMLRLVFAMYLLIIIVVLINLLIAMMSDTYRQIQSKSDLEWKYSKAKFVRQMSKSRELPVPLNLFSVCINWCLSFRDNRTTSSNNFNATSPRHSIANPLKWDTVVHHYEMSEAKSAKSIPF